ncbi:MULTISPECIES: hypothetical protein [Microcoleaceae]|uniref:hypothetical protein n=1 Tax=Microcoleaceae TaxID=1892252 RepID=UPI001D158FAA|nr:hypothetical protein [Tychonema sp. LEGE 06208]
MQLWQALFTIAIIAAVSQGTWQNALALALFLVASVVFVVMKNLLLALFDLLFVFATLLNAGGWVWGLFYQPGIMMKLFMLSQFLL